MFDVYGYPIVATGQHFANRVGDGFVDVRGMMSGEEFVDGISGIPEKVRREELVQDLNAGVYKCGYFDERALRKAVRLVKSLSK